MWSPSRHMTSIQRRLNVNATSWRYIDIETTLYKRYVPAGHMTAICGAFFIVCLVRCLFVVFALILYCYIDIASSVVFIRIYKPRRIPIAVSVSLRLLYPRQTNYVGVYSFRLFRNNVCVRACVRIFFIKDFLGTTAPTILKFGTHTLGMACCIV